MEKDFCSLKWEAKAENIMVLNWFEVYYRDLVEFKDYYSWYTEFIDNRSNFVINFFDKLTTIIFNKKLNSHYIAIVYSCPLLHSHKMKPLY
jgi:hypothetical protein